LASTQKRASESRRTNAAYVGKVADDGDRMSKTARVHRCARRRGGVIFSAATTRSP
jgi:hypothetical protein